MEDVLAVISYDAWTRAKSGRRRKSWTISSLQRDAYRMDESPKGRRRAA